MNSFFIASSPELYFGEGSIKYLPEIIRRYGNNLLLITGKVSFEQLLLKVDIKEYLQNFSVTHIRHSGEPTVEQVEELQAKLRGEQFDCIVSIGGGSIIDLGKAISAMLTVDGSIEHYLEGLPEFRPHPGTKIPMIAVPTTAGTGSEATKNAVISKYGKNGFKRSIRHNNFIPDVAIIDPSLQITCPPHVTAASGFDALTQLIESYLSPQGNLYTDILAEKGIALASQSLVKAYQEPQHIQHRCHMAMAAYLSGITLAHAGLGAIHGFASVIGGMYNAPHGAICGSLLSQTLATNLKKMLKHASVNRAHNKIVKLYEALFLKPCNISPETAVELIIELINSWATEMKISTLSQLGVKKEDLEKIAEQTQLKNNPVMLEKDELIAILMASL